VKDEKHCPHHRFEVGVEFIIMGIHIMEGLFQDLGIEKVNA